MLWIQVNIIDSGNFSCQFHAVQSDSRVLLGDPDQILYSFIKINGSGNASNSKC